MDSEARGTKRTFFLVALFLANSSFLNPRSCLAQNVITTVAGSQWVFRGDGGPAVNAPLGWIRGVAVDSSGSAFAADPDNHLVVKISPAGVLSVVAGNGTQGFSGDGGLATSASLRDPGGIVVDAAGNLYIADTSNQRIRKVTPAGIITTVAGNGSLGFAGDGGLATSASLDPSGLVVDAVGNLYIADRANDRIRKVTATGTISTVAGGGSSLSDGVPATSAHLSFPWGVAIDRAGNIYVADTNYSQVRKVTPAGIISTVAGNRSFGFAGDGRPATEASLYFPNGVAVDAVGNAYIADTFNNRIRKVTPAGIISTVAGNGSFRFSGDGGPATSASFRLPGGVAVDTAGNLFVADKDNHRVRRITQTRTINTVAGDGTAVFSGDGGPGTSASLRFPNGVAVDLTGNIYIADAQNRRVRKVSTAGTISTVAGNGGSDFSGDGGPATGAGIFVPDGVALDAAGNLYIADRENNRIRKVTPTGTISTVAGNGVRGFSGDGGSATATALNYPTGVAVDAAGNLFIADHQNNRIRKVTSAGTMTTFAGNGTSGFSGDGGQATSASLSPNGVTVDAAGNLYIADTSHQRIRKVTPAGIISTVAGNGSLGFAGDGGLATSASLIPAGVAVDAAGNLYITDTGSHRVRKVLALPPAFSLLPATVSMTSPSGSEVASTRQVAVTSDAIGLAWTARGDSWLSVSPTSGTVPGLITVSADASSLTPGNYRSTVTVQAPLALPTTQTVTVDLTVTKELTPQLTVEPGSLVVEVPLNTGNPPQQSLRVTNAGGGGTLRWTAQGQVLGGGNWLGVLSTSGSASGRAGASIPVRLNVAGLQPGLYSGLVEVNSSEISQTQAVPVTLLLSQPTRTILTTQRGMRFTAFEGSRTTVAQSLGIINTGQGSMDWTVQPSTLSGGSWLSATPSSGQSQAGSLSLTTASVQVNPASLTAGSYSGFLRVNAPGANNSPYLVTVELEVLPAGTSIGVQVRPPQLIFTAQAGTSSPSSQTVRLVTPRNASVEARGGLITLEGGNWLQVLPSNLVLSASDPRTVVVQPTLGNLSPGVHRGALTFQFDDGSEPQVVEIIFLVVGTTASAASRGDATACTAKQLIAADRSLGKSFTATAGSAATLDVQVVDDCANAVTDATVVATFSNGDPPLTLASAGDGGYAATWRPVTASDQVTVMIRANQGSLPVAEVRAQGKVQSNDKAPALFAGGIVSAASFAAGVPLAPGSIVSVFGRNLATATTQASSLPLPKTLAGATLQIGGIDVPLFFASNGQINAQLPFELQPATRQQVVVRGTATITLPETITIAPVRLGIFTTDGKQGAVLDTQGRLVDGAAPAAAGDIVVVYATGLGAVDRAVPTGQAAPGIAPGEPPAKAATPVTATIGGQPAVVHFAGLTPGFVGLYQVNVQVPAGVTPGTTQLVILQSGVPSNTVTVAVRKGSTGPATAP